MSLPYMPGWFDEIKESLPQVVGGIRSIVNPNWQNDEALKQAIQRDPTALQKLRDLEANSPGILARVYGKGTVGNIMGLGESAENTQQRALTGARSEILSDPQAAKDLAGKDVVEARTGKEKLAAAERENRVGAATEQATIDEAGYKNTILQLQAKRFRDEDERNTALKFIRDQFNKAGRDPFKELMSGKMRQEEQEALFADEGTWRALTARLEKYKEDAATGRASMNIREGNMLNVLPTARQIWAQAKTGDVLSYVELLSNPAALQKVNAIKSGTAKAETDQDKRLVAAFDGFQKIEDDQRDALARQALRDVMQSLVTMDSKKEFAKMEPGQRALKINAVNEQLGLLSQYTNKNLQVRFIEGGFLRSDRLELVDSKTQKVTPLEQVDSNTLLENDPFEKEAARLLETHKGNLTSARNAVTSSTQATPEQKSQLLRELDRQFNAKRFKQ